MKFIDIGDIVGVSGRIMKTQTGQVTVRAKEFFLMTKALRPLPEKFHGLTDIEEIYRRRYVDLIMNDDSKTVFENRSKIITGMRKILDDEKFIEVETPVLHATLGGASAQPFVTHHNALDMQFKLRIATELHLKRLIVGGFNKVFEIGRLFRNEGISIKHNPEFTTIEVYQAYASEKEMISLTEKIISELAIQVRGTTELEYQGEKISLKAPFKKIEMVDLIKEVTGVDFNEIKTFEEAKEVAKKHNVQLEKHHTSTGYVINELYEQKSEETIKNPTFVTGYPVEVSPLAKARYGSTKRTDALPDCKESGEVLRIRRPPCPFPSTSLDGFYMYCKYPLLYSGSSSGIQQHNTKSRAARTSSKRPKGVLWGAVFSNSGFSRASAAIWINTSTKASRVSLLSVSVGSMSRPST